MLRRDQTHTHDQYLTRSDAAVRVARAVAAVSPVFSAGGAEVPAIGPGASVTVRVRLIQAMGNTDYAVVPVITGYGVGILASLSITSATVANRRAVDVVVKNSGVLQITGGVVMVHAFDVPAPVPDPPAAAAVR